MNVIFTPAKNTHRWGLRPILTSGVLILWLISSCPSQAQDKETKASVGVMVGGATPIGEIRLELPSGTDLTIVDRASDILKVSKGPFAGTVPVQQTSLWHPTPSPKPSPSSSASPPLAPESLNPGFIPVVSSWGHAVSHLRMNPGAHTLVLATACVLFLLLCFLVLLFLSLRRRRRRFHQSQMLRDELALVRSDLKELHTFLEVPRKHQIEIPIQQPAGASASCPHCDEVVLLSSLQKGANTCSGCGGEFLYN